MQRLAFLLFPFALIYDLITRIRNFLYDQGYLKSQMAALPTILVGNLRVGGTGKTPMVEYLIRLLQKDYALGTLSRGYGRRTRGFLKADPIVSPEGIGDEPYQIYQKYGNQIQVFVGEDRASAIQKIKNEKNTPEIILLDDAFQHRSVRSHLNILLTTYQDPFYKDYLLPMGRLRESRSNAKRADAIVISKCPPHLSTEEKNQIKKETAKYFKKSQAIFFSSIGYGKPEAWGKGARFTRQVILMTGIAKVDALEDYVLENYQLLDRLYFPDHHQYKKDDFEQLGLLLAKHARSKPVVLTTEKDAVKVKSFYPEGFIREIPIFVIPIQVEFSPEDANQLNQLIQQKVFEKDHFGE